MKSITKLTVVLLVSLSSHYSSGQFSVQKKRKSYLGLVAGLNYSFPKVTNSYSVLSSIASSENPDKTYGKFGRNKGAQFGVRYSYNFTNLISVSVGFGYQSVSFNYRTQFSWSDTMGNQAFDREMHHIQKISYFTFPIMARWDLTEGQFKPYLQGGLFMDFRNRATKVINYDNIIDGKETENQTSSSALVSITDNTEKFNIGLIAGVGLSYYTKYVTFGVETNFRYGFMKVVNDQNRYSDDNGFALKYLDVLDQLKLSSLNIELSVSAPIGNSVVTKSVRRKRYNSYY